MFQQQRIRGEQEKCRVLVKRKHGIMKRNNSNTKLGDNEEYPCDRDLLYKRVEVWLAVCRSVIVSY